MATEPSLDDFKKLLVHLEERPVKPKQCKFAKWYNGLSEDKAEIIKVMLDSDLNHVELWNQLSTVITVPMCKDTMRTHRQGVCACR